MARVIISEEAYWTALPRIVVAWATAASPWIHQSGSDNPTAATSPASPKKMEATLPKPCLILAIWTRWRASVTVSVVIQSLVPQKSCCGIMLNVDRWGNSGAEPMSRRRTQPPRGRVGEQRRRTYVEAGDVLIRQNDHGVARQRASQRVGQWSVHSLQCVGGTLAIGFDEVWEDNVKVLRADCLPLLVGRVLSPEGSGQQDCQRHEMFHEAYEVRRK